MRLILDKLKLIEREKKKIIYKPSTRKESRNFGKKVIFFSIEINVTELYAINVPELMSLHRCHESGHE